jgi:hypothetical protein
MLRVRDILVQIRICVSVTLNERIRILLLSSVTAKTATKKYFFCYYFSIVHLNNFSKIEVIKKSQRNSNQGFSSYFLLDDRKIRTRTPD